MQLSKKKIKNLEVWHRWFAWFPVEIVGNGWRKTVWLETVERKGEWGCGVYDNAGWTFEYREATDSKAADQVSIEGD